MDSEIGGYVYTILFLECNGLMFGFDRWKSLWSSLLDVILAEKNGEKYLLLLSSECFSRQTLFASESSLFAGFLKDVQDTGGGVIGLLSEPIDNALFPWADVLSRTGLINFLEPVEGREVTTQNLIDIGECRIINFGNNANCVNNIPDSKLPYTHCFATNTMPSNIEQKNIHWILNGMPEISLENEKCVELSKFEKGIRLLRKSETCYSYSSVFLPSCHKKMPLQEIPLVSKKSWLEVAEEELFDEFAEAGKCGVFWKRGIDTKRIGEIRKRISLGDDADDFFEFLKKTIHDSCVIKLSAKSRK